MLRHRHKYVEYNLILKRLEYYKKELRRIKNGHGQVDMKMFYIKKRNRILNQLYM